LYIPLTESTKAIFPAQFGNGSFFRRPRGGRHGIGYSFGSFEPQD
jgi:hypothetical protein